MNMESKYIDLTHTFSNETPSSPFDQTPVLKQVKFIDKDSYNDTLLTSTMHIGTHVDAPSHMIQGAKTIDQFPISKFIGKGVLINCLDEKTITLTDEHREKIKKDSIVIIYTGMDKVIGTDKYYTNHPIISEEFCDWLIEREIKILGLDFFSPDQLPSLIHKKLLGKEILIVENLKNVNLVANMEEFNLFFIPIKIQTEGAFIRAFAEKIK